MTQDLSRRAVTQANLAECFWFRGLIPAEWTRVDEPTHVERWKGLGQDQADTFSFGSGTMDKPLVLFGDASGGADTRSTTSSSWVGCWSVLIR
eukprot:9482844-Pyramimonas_sp.AAC.1